MSRDVPSCTHWLRPHNHSIPPHLDSYKRALLVSQEIQHLFMHPLSQSNLKAADEAVLNNVHNKIHKYKITEEHNNHEHVNY
jgi:hypothetical protein